MRENAESHIMIKLLQICTLHYPYNTCYSEAFETKRVNVHHISKVTATTLVLKIPHEDKKRLAGDNYT